MDWFVHFFEFKCKLLGKLYPRFLLNFITVASLSNWTMNSVHWTLFCLKFHLIILLFLFFAKESFKCANNFDNICDFYNANITELESNRTVHKIDADKKESQTKWNITWCYDNSDLILLLLFQGFAIWFYLVLSVQSAQREFKVNKCDT